MIEVKFYKTRYICKKKKKKLHNVSSFVYVSSGGIILHLRLYEKY